MQKVQNVNRIFFLLLILPFSLFGQSIKEGKYYVKNWDLLREHWANFSFHQNNIFEYADGGDIGISKYGKGHYTLTKDSLFLNFDLTEIKYEGYHISKSYLSSPNSMLIDIIVYNLEKNKVLPNTKIMIPEIGFKTFITDTTGKVQFSIPKEEKERTLIITHNDNENDFHGRYGIELSQYPRNYEIEVFLNEEVWGSAIKNVTWKYKIKKFKKDYIELQSKNGSILKLEKVKIKEEDDPFERERN